MKKFKLGLSFRANFKGVKVTALLGVVFVSYSCAPSLYIPSLADANKTGLNLDDLNLGRKLYVQNCGSCHNLYAPNHLKASEWPGILTVMQQKAKVSTKEVETIRNYFSNFQQQTRPISRVCCL
jgi:hypothetical protein